MPLGNVAGKLTRKTLPHLTVRLAQGIFELVGLVVVVGNDRPFNQRGQRRGGSSCNSSGALDTTSNPLAGTRKGLDFINLSSHAIQTGVRRGWSWWLKEHEGMVDWGTAEQKVCVTRDLPCLAVSSKPYA